MKVLIIDHHRKILITLVAMLLWFSDTHAQRSTYLNKSLEQVQSLYRTEQYEIAYDSLLSIHQNYYNSLNEEGQATLLDWGIRLSFLAEDWPKLDHFISEYYALDPYFSADILTESSTQLKEYISNFVRTKSEQFVYVNKHRQNIDFIPATVTVYSKDDIERLGARNLLDLIRITPGFAEIGDNNERVMGTRGSSSTSMQDVLFLINGHRITDILTNTNAPDWISLDYVEQIELVRGPGSALYGGSAFSGVVNIITKSGRFQNLNEFKIDIGTGNDFSNNEFENNTYHFNYQVGKKISNTEGLYVSATYFQSGGSEIDYSKSNDQPILPDNNGTILRAADLTGKEYINRYAPGYNVILNYNRKSLQVSANSQSSTYIYSRPSSLNLWNSFDQDSLRQQRRRIDKRNFIQVEYDLLDNSPKSYNELRLKVSGDHFYKDFTTNVYSYGINGNSRLVGNEYRGTVNVEYSSDSLFSGGGKLKNHFLVGAEAFVNNWFYNYYTEVDTTMVLDKLGDQFSDPGDERNEYIAAAYIQTEQHLIKDKLIGTAGVRINYHNKYSTFEEFNWGEQYSPRFALVFLPQKNKHGLNSYKFKLLYNSAFLPPPFLYRKGGINQFVGADSLKSQSTESGEFVIYGDINKHFSYSALTYINKIDEFIERQGESYINEPTEKRVSGYEVELKYQSTSETFDWYSFVNYSFTQQLNFKDSLKHNYLDVFKSNLYYSADSLERFPASHINAGISAAFKKRRIFSEPGDGFRFEKLTIGATAQWIGGATIESNYFINDQGLLETTTSPERQQLPDALVFNSQLKVYTNTFSLGVSVYNLLNHEYYLPSAISSIQRQRAEGRMIYLSLNYFFKHN